MGITTIFENVPISTISSNGHLFHNIFAITTKNSNYVFQFFDPQLVASALTTLSIATMNALAFAQLIQACDHIALERLDNSKQYGILLANADKHAFYRAHIAACGRISKWNLLSDSAAAALRTVMYGDASTIDNGYTSDEGFF
jgi:hypothetical protein